MAVSYNFIKNDNTGGDSTELTYREEKIREKEREWYCRRPEL